MINEIARLRKADATLEKAKQQSAMANYDIGRSLAQRRKKAGMTLRGVAAEMGCSGPWVCDLEKGKRTWSEEWIERYLKALKS